jgi:hypothetical protein
MSRSGLAGKPSLALVGLVLGLAGAGPAAAEEVKTPVHAVTILNLLSAPVEPRQTAYDESLRGEVAPPPATDGRVLPDGSVRYGSGRTSLTVTVKNPCPPGTAHYEPPPLPGRRPRD